MASNTNKTMIAVVQSDVAGERNSARPPPDQDAALVQRARHGDRAAFAELFRKHHARIYGMCARLLWNRTEVEDAVQQTFLEAWRCLHRFEGKSRFTTWLTRIAIHTSFSTRRRLRRLVLGGLADAGSDEGVGASAEELDPRPPPDEMVDYRARQAALQQALQQLSTKKRVVLVLADLEGMTSPEIASVLDIPEATVRTRLFHARKELVRHLRDHPGFADEEVTP